MGSSDRFHSFITPPRSNEIEENSLTSKGVSSRNNNRKKKYKSPTWSRESSKNINHKNFPKVSPKNRDSSHQNDYRTKFSDRDIHRQRFSSNPYFSMKHRELIEDNNSNIITEGGRKFIIIENILTTKG